MFLVLQKLFGCSDVAQFRYLLFLNCADVLFFKALEGGSEGVVIFYVLSVKGIDDGIWQFLALISF